MKKLYLRLCEAWCYLMHPAPMRPVRGHYRCPSCLREYPVPWEKGVNRWNQRDEPVPVLKVVEFPKRSAA